MKSKKVYGAGINDAEYKVRIQEHYYDEVGKRRTVVVWTCPYYKRWLSMLYRCYSPLYHERAATYIGCSVCDDWIYFTNFKAWMEQQDWEGKDLDKDILVEGNKEYGPDTCVFVSQRVNKFLNVHNNTTPETLTGATWDTKRKRYVVKCGNPILKKSVTLGRFIDPYEAHTTWFEYKLKMAYQLIEEEGLTENLATAIIQRALGMQQQAPK